MGRRQWYSDHFLDWSPVRSLKKNGKVNSLLPVLAKESQCHIYANGFALTAGPYHKVQSLLYASVGQQDGNSRSLLLQQKVRGYGLVLRNHYSCFLY